MTFFMYLSNVTDGTGGSAYANQPSFIPFHNCRRIMCVGVGVSGTWFPYAKLRGAADVQAPMQLNDGDIYRHYNRLEQNKSGSVPPSSEMFKDYGVRVQPRQGDAILWPNTDPTNIYKQNKLSKHASEPVAAGQIKWAANAWIHLHDFRGQALAEKRDKQQARIEAAKAKRGEL